MKKYIVIIITSMVVLAAYSQETATLNKETTEKLTKEQKLEQKRMEEEKTARLVDWMIENRQFVLEADYLGNQYGDRVVVRSNLNFIAIDSSDITIQLASSINPGGVNGMGGITADGDIQKFEVKKTGKKYPVYNITVFTTTHVGSYDIFFSISPNGNAQATISSTTAGKLIYSGKIVPISETRVYKANPI